MYVKAILSKAAALCIGVLLFPAVVGAVPAMPFPITMRQPDGTVFEGHVRGDEFAGWHEDGEGRAVVRNRETGWWEYGALSPDGRSFLPTGRVVDPSAEPPADMPRHVVPSKDDGKVDSFRRMLESVRAENAAGRPPAPRADFIWDPPPLTGQRKLLVILVEFTDRSLSTTPAEWNSKVFSMEAGNKSVTRFYFDNSAGQLILSPASHIQSGSPQGIVRVALATPHPNYGGNILYEQETAWLNAALAKAATVVDFAAFDANGDQVLQTGELSVCFVAAGYDTSSGAPPPSIWAHSWGGTPGITPGSSLYIQRWAVQGELDDLSMMMGIGSLTHELGHSLCGLPDLYDVSETNAGLGAFSLMAYGGWGCTGASWQYGDTPVALDAWSRENLSWGSARPAPAPGELLTLPAALSASSTYAKLVNTEMSYNEYWLAETRRPSSLWDAGMWVFLGPDWDGGVLILHVDNVAGTNEYDPAQPQGVMAEEASSAVCSPSRARCGGAQTNFFYQGNNESFGPGTVPASSYHDNRGSGLALTQISEPGDLMTASLDENAVVVVVDEGGGSDLGRAYGGSGGGGGFCFLSSVAVDGQGGSSRSELPGAFLLLSAFAGAFALLILRKE